jgi:hypothetical protein
VGGWYLQGECVRVIEIEPESSLFELRSAILNAVDFDTDHSYEFRAGRSPQNRKVVFDDTADDISLDQVYPLPKSCKLYFHYDFGDDWCFEIRKSREKPHEPDPGVKYPRVVKAIGTNPIQYGESEE